MTALEHAKRIACESEARLQGLLDHAPIAISTGDLDGRSVLINRVAGELIGRSVEELLARSPTEFYDPRAAVEIEAAERAVRDGEGAITFELSGRDPDRHYLVTKHPVRNRNAAGTVVAVGRCLGGCF